MKKITLLFVLVLSVLFNSYGQYITNGSASFVGANEYQLTPALNSQGGSVWYQTKLNLNYDFSISSQINLGNKDANGADGIAFVLQPLNVNQGGIGGGIGYFGISPSLDVEFDTWQNPDRFDPPQDHLAINKNGSVDHTGPNVLLAPFLFPNIEDGNWHNAVFDWVASTKTFTVTFDGVPHVIVYDLIANIFGGSPFAYWGFTAGTGAANNDQRVRIGAVQFVEEITITGSVTNIVCPGASSGAVDITVTGGTGGYTFAWTGPNSFTAASEDISGVPGGTYTVTVTDNSNVSKSATFTINDPNLVVNGNFEAGNTGFSSGYSLNSSGIINEGEYEVAVNPNHPCFSGPDHTPIGPGNAMYVNGSGVPNTIVWEETINVAPNTNYYFSAWAKGQCFNSNPAILQFSINGSQIGVNFSPTGTTQWEQFFTPWNSGSNTTATIRLVNQNTAAGGNDFGLDDILFTTIAPVQIASVTKTNASCSDASDGSITISATGGIGPYQYSIDNGANYFAGSDPHTFTGLPLGTYTVRVKDNCNTESNAQTVTMGYTDSIPPAISCPANIAVNNDPGLCGATICYPTPTIIENCKPATPAGYTFKANFGNSYYYQANVQTNYSTAQSNAIAAGGHLAVITSAAENNAIAASGAGFSWMGGNDLVTNGVFKWVTCEPFTFSNFCPGEPNGGTFENFLEFETGGCWNDLSAGSLRFSLLEIEAAKLQQTTGLPQNAFFPVGTTTNTFVATDASGNSSSCSFTVIVTDTEDPKISCPANVNHTADSGKCSYSFTLTAATATDNCPGVTVAGVRDDAMLLSDSYPVGTTTISWTATDAHGHSVSCNQTVTVTDNEDPKITCPPNITHTADSGKCSYSFKPIVATATDNCPGVTIDAVRDDGMTLSDPYPVGTTTITWTAKDVHGHSVSCNQTVTVTDDENPKISCPGNVNHTADAGRCSYKFTPNAATATDNCPGVKVAGVRDDGKPLSDPYPVGITTITWTATDAHGHSVSCNQTVTVTDDEKPKANCKNVTVTLVNGAAGITASDVNNNSTDNCGIKSITVSPNTFTCSNIGNNTVTLTVTDVHNNTQTCTATVTVVGAISSFTITAIPSNNVYTGGIPTNIYLGYGPQSVTLSVNATGGSPFTYSWTGTGTLSCTNCAAPVFAPAAAGTYNFTVTVTNKYGCKTTCSIRICVLDIRDGNDGKKVFVCHVPEGNINNPQTLSIGISAVPAHIPAHTLDHLGRCDQVPCSSARIINTSIVSEEITGAVKVSVLPNPNSGQFTVRLNNLKGSKAGLTIVDANGATIEKRSVMLNTKENTILFNLRKEASGMYYIKVVSDEAVYTEKVVIQR